MLSTAETSAKNNNKRCQPTDYSQFRQGYRGLGTDFGFIPITIGGIAPLPQYPQESAVQL